MRHPRESGDLENTSAKEIPACAGMTSKECRVGIAHQIKHKREI